MVASVHQVWLPAWPRYAVRSRMLALLESTRIHDVFVAARTLGIGLSIVESCSAKGGENTYLVPGIIYLVRCKTYSCSVLVLLFFSYCTRIEFMQKASAINYRNQAPGR